MDGRTFSRILLIKPSSLGDIIHALPVLHGLRRRYPDATIDWLIGKPFVSLLADHPALDEVIPFDRKRFGRIGRSWPVTRDFFRFLRSLRRRRYDLVVDLQGLFRTGFIARATGAAVRIGFRDAREGAWLFYSHPLPRTGPNTHAVTRNMFTASLLGFAEGEVSFELGLKEAPSNAARDLLREARSQGATRLIAVVPGARWETKVWPPERFSEAIDRFHATSDIRCVLVGGPDDASLCTEIERRCVSVPINLAGKTSLPVLAALFGEVDCVLCQDSGPMHLAAPLGKPLVCIVGPTNAARTGPYGRLADVIRLDVPCAPCYFRRLSQCGHEHRCMRDLSVEAVFLEVERRLSEADKRGVGR